MLEAAVIVNALCTAPTTTRMAAEALKLLQLDTAELLQLGMLIEQVSWGLFGAVSAKFHAVRILLVM